MKNNIIAGVAVTAALASNAAIAGVCEVTTDPAGDSLHPTMDIVALNMGTDGGVLTGEIAFSTAPDLSLLSSATIIMKDSKYIRAYVDAPAFEVYAVYGTFTDNGDGTVNFASEGDAEAKVDGNSLVMWADTKVFKLGGSIPVRAEVAAPLITGLDVTDPATYTIGDSCASARDYNGANYEETAELRAAALPSSAAGGSLGWMTLLMTGLLGLRRRFK